MKRIMVLVAASLALAGCGNVPQAFTAQVPTSGPIQQGAQVSGNSVDQFIRVIARPPRPDMTAPEIVQGFLDASASFDGDHAVARQYLTADASERWDSSSGVVVYEGAPSLQESGPNIRFSAAQAGVIGPSGRYQVEAPGTEATTTFGLVETDEGLRIDRLPNGLLLSQNDVDRAFRSYALYFFDPTFQILVPDSRMIPVIGPGLATTLVRRLLEGPNEWLRPAVRTGFPDGVNLNIDAVLIDGGVAQVDLDASAQLADDSSRQALSQQLVWTLRQLPDVQAVSITSAGQPLFVPGWAVHSHVMLGRTSIPRAWELTQRPMWRRPLGCAKSSTAGLSQSRAKLVRGNRSLSISRFLRVPLASLGWTSTAGCGPVRSCLGPVCSNYRR